MHYTLPSFEKLKHRDRCTKPCGSNRLHSQAHETCMYANSMPWDSVFGPTLMRYSAPMTQATVSVSWEMAFGQRAWGALLPSKDAVSPSKDVSALFKHFGTKDIVPVSPAFVQGLAQLRRNVFTEGRCVSSRGLAFGQSSRSDLL